LIQDLKCSSGGRSRIHITGISAGGLLAAVATLQGLRRFPNNCIASGIFLCPMLDPTCSSDSFVANETASWLVPTAWLRWCWQVYLNQQQQSQPPPPPSQINDDAHQAAAATTHPQEEETPSSTDTTATTPTAAATSSASYCWWKELQESNGAKLAPLMSPLWDDFQDLIVDRNKTTNDPSASLHWPRFLITTNRGDPLHDDGVALVQKLRTAVTQAADAAAMLDSLDDDDDDGGNNTTAAADVGVVVVQHLDHDGTHCFGTFLDSSSKQELIHACTDIFFPPPTVSK
jgi:acetyl esterase/lipase